MKRAITILFVFLLATAMVSAQESKPLLSKGGIPILPQAGDFAIGVNAIPMFEFVGNAFNNTVNNTIFFGFLDNTSRFIFGKYFAEDLLAYRFGLRVGQTRLTESRYLLKDQLVAGADPEWITDSRITSRTNIMLGIGIEKRKGVHRIQGFYGLDLALTVMNGKETFHYGNEFSKDNTNPTTTNFGNNIWWGSRVTSIHEGLGFLVGARGFVGMEIFILPKLSLGGEFGWGPAIGFLGKSHANVESWDGVKDELKTDEVPNAKGNVINIDTDNGNGVIKLMFHF
jgi:hypothetical protein